MITIPFRASENNDCMKKNKVFCFYYVNKNLTSKHKYLTFCCVLDYKVLLNYKSLASHFIQSRVAYMKMKNLKLWLQNFHIKRGLTSSDLCIGRSNKINEHKVNPLEFIWRL